MIYVLYDDAGKIAGAAASADWADMAAGDTLHVLQHPEEIDIREYEVRSGQLVRKDEADIVAEVAARELHEAWRQLRFKRGRLLLKTDWTQAPDAPVDAAAWAAYRAALRDLPQNTEDPRNVVWPTPPA